ncbi:MAG: sugar ABC transporter permease [Sphaerochaetaceae bacterium]|nr:sugar ABC transporter permease [Sphaerochaetaceae bacterium]
MKKNNGFLFSLPVILLVLIFFVYPLFDVFRISFMEWTVIGTKKYIGFSNYLKTFQEFEFWQSLSNTLIYTIMVTPLIFIPALLAAILLKSNNTRNSILRTIFFIPCTISLVASSYIWNWLLNDSYGIFNYFFIKMGFVSEGINWFSSTWSARVIICISVAWKTFGFSMIFILAGLSSISPDIYEAAEIDGCNKKRAFFSITLPLVKPTLMLALILSIAGSFKGFDQFLIMTGGGPMRTTQPIIMYINKVAFNAYDMGRSAAISVLFLLILLFVSYQQIRLGGYYDDD